MRLTNAIAIAIIAFTSSQALAMPVPNPWDRAAGPRQNPAQGRNVNVGAHRAPGGVAPPAVAPGGAPGGHAPPAHAPPAHAPHHRRDMEYLQARMQGNNGHNGHNNHAANHNAPNHNPPAPPAPAPAQQAPANWVPAAPANHNAAPGHNAMGGHRAQGPGGGSRRRSMQYLQARGREFKVYDNGHGGHVPADVPRDQCRLVQIPPHGNITTCRNAGGFCVFDAGRCQLRGHAQAGPCANVHCA